MLSWYRHIRAVPIIDRAGIILASSALIVFFLILPNKICKFNVPKTYYTFVVSSKVEIIRKQLETDLTKN
jgi:hypothetical protein